MAQIVVDGPATHRDEEHVILDQVQNMACEDRDKEETDTCEPAADAWYASWCVSSEKVRYGISTNCDGIEQLSRSETLYSFVLATTKS